MSDPEGGVTVVLPSLPSIWATTDSALAIRLDSPDSDLRLDALNVRDLAITEAIVRLALARIEAERNRRAYGIELPTAAASTTDGGL